MTIHENLVAIFADRSAADHALTELNQKGFGHDEVSVMAKNSEDAEDVKLYVATGHPDAPPDNLDQNGEPTVSFLDNKYVKAQHDIADKHPAAMKNGATTGTLIGTALGLSAVLIPGIGPILAGGAIAAAVAATATWAAAGASIGMLVGLVKDIRIPEDREVLYKTEFEKGNFIVIIHPNTDTVNRFEQAQAIVSSHKPKIMDAY